MVPLFAYYYYTSEPSEEVLFWVLAYTAASLGFLIYSIVSRLLLLRGRLRKAALRREQAVLDLQGHQKAGRAEELKALQEHMASADRYFNEVVILYNNTIEAFPSSWAAKWLGLRPATPLPIEL